MEELPRSRADSSPILSVIVEDRQPYVVRLCGELDLAGVSEIRDRLSDVRGDVDVDCSGLRFIDCAGLGVLVEAWAVLDAQGGTLVLIDPSPPMQRLLKLTGLDAVFRVRSNELGL